MPDEKITKTSSKPLNMANVRPVLQAVARLIASDRRPTVLATEKAEILLANAPANKLGLDETKLLDAFQWKTLCAGALRSGSVAVSATLADADLEGELVHLPLGQADGYILRLAESNQEAALLRNRARTATLMRVSHDLRTPIQSLLATTELFFQGANDQKKVTEADREKLSRAANQTLDHIDNVLKVIRGELTASTLQADEEFSLNAEVQSILDMIEPIARKWGATMNLTMEPKDAVKVHGPLRFIRALVQNMIDNSVKHGGPTIDITVQSTAFPSESKSKSSTEVLVSIEVSDLGGGLPVAQKNRLFKAIGHMAALGPANAMADEPANERPSAGLNVLAHALRQLGGKLEVLDRTSGSVSQEGTHDQKVIGTTLRALFTLEQVADNAISHSDPSAPRRGANALPCLSGVGILVVEDSPASRDWLVHSLRDAGAKVWAAEHGLKAISILHNSDNAKNIDLLLSDMTLPQMSGVELVRQLRADQTAGTLEWSGKMMGLTAHVDTSLRDACLQLGMERVLEKPIRPAQLCQAIWDVTKSSPTDQLYSENTTDAVANETSPLPKEEAAALLGDYVVAELVDQLGVEGTCSFMIRAHAEAQAALDTIRRNGIQTDTDRMLHAATGATGLTGLRTVESCLRKIELALEKPNPNLTSQLSDLDAALQQSAKAIEQLKQSGSNLIS